MPQIATALRVDHNWECSRAAPGPDSAAAPSDRADPGRGAGAGGAASARGRRRSRTRPGGSDGLERGTATLFGRASLSRRRYSGQGCGLAGSRRVGEHGGELRPRFVRGEERDFRARGGEGPGTTTCAVPTAAASRCSAVDSCRSAASRSARRRARRPARAFASAASRSWAELRRMEGASCLVSCHEACY